MSPRLPVVSGRRTVSVLEQIGFSFISQKGSHVKLRNDDGRVVIIPMHNELARGTLKSILHQASIDVDEFLQLLSE